MRLLLFAALIALCSGCAGVKRRPLTFELPAISEPQASLEAAYRTGRVLSVRGSRIETATGTLDADELRRRALEIDDASSLALLDEASSLESRSQWLNVPSILAILGGLAASMAGGEGGSATLGLGVAGLGGVGLGFGLSAFPRAETKRWMAAKEYNLALRRRLCLDPATDGDVVYRGTSFAKGEKSRRAGESDSARLWRFLTQK